MILIKEEHPDEDNFKENSSFKSQTETFNVNFNFKTEIKQNVEESIFKSDFVITEPIIKAEEELMTNSMAEQFKCLLCQNNFDSNESLYNHSKIIHKKTKIFCHCDICKEFFPTKSELQKHTEMLHFDSKNLKCNVCQKSFSLKGNLINTLVQFMKK